MPLSNLYGGYSLGTNPTTGHESFIGNGSNTIIDAGVSLPDSFNGDFIGMSFWMKPYSITQWQRAVWLTNEQSDVRVIDFTDVTSGYVLNSDASSSHDYSVCSVGSIGWDVNQWNHVFLWIDTINDEAKIFKNGVEIGSGTASNSINTTANNFALMGHTYQGSGFNNPGGVFNGEISDPFISTNPDFKNYINEFYTNTQDDTMFDEAVFFTVEYDYGVEPGPVDPPIVSGINRDPTRFSNLNWQVSVINQSGTPWTDLEGNESYSFSFCSIPENPFYYTLQDNFHYVDQALNVDSITNGFSGSPHVDALAPIRTAGFSISNLELWYHKLCEMNEGDLNVFQGAKVEIYMNNSLNPIVHWDTNQSLWIFSNGSFAPQQTDPTTITPLYPTNEASDLIFSGTIEDIGFSSQTTSFNCVGIEDRQNVVIGNVVDPLAQKKDRGNIFPITYGLFETESDLAPVVLSREQNDVPNIILGEYKHFSLLNVRVYDKLSEKTFEAKNDFSVDADNNVLTFASDIPSAELGANVSEDVTEWDQGAQVDTVLTDKFNAGNADSQLLTDIDGELVGFHNDKAKTEITNSPYGDIEPQPAASRSWGDSESSAHVTTSELFEIDSDYQNAIAKIEFDLKILGTYYVGPVTNSPFPFDNIIPTFATSTGNFWNLIKRPSVSSTDGAFDISSFMVDLSTYSTDAPWITSGGKFILDLESIGLEGTIEKFEVDFSSWMDTAWADRDTGGAFGPNFRVRNFVGLYVDTDSLDPNDSYFVQLNGGNDALGTTEPIPFGEVKNSSGTSNIGAATNDLDDFYKLKTESIDLSGAITNVSDLQSSRISWQGQLSADYIFTPGKYPLVQPDFISIKVEAKVEASNGLWFCNTQGRVNINDNAIINSVGAIKDIYQKELGQPNDFGDTTNERIDWECSFSLFGEQKPFRKWLKEFSYQYHMGAFYNDEGKLSLIALDRKENPDHTITPDGVLLAGDLQAIDYSFTDREELYSEILIKYRKNYANKDFNAILQIGADGIVNTEPLEFITGPVAPGAIIERFQEAKKKLGLFADGEKKQLVIESDYIRKSDTAERLLEGLSDWYTTTKASVKVSGNYVNFFGIQVGQQVNFSQDFGGLPAKIRDGQFLVTKKTIVPNISGSGSIDLDLIEIPEGA